jgi:hypothetical protein
MINIFVSCNLLDDNKEIFTKKPTINSNTSKSDSTRITIDINISSDGESSISEKGVCWSTHENPTINDAKLVYEGDACNFSITIENLNPRTTYYLCAYAKNKKGISYSNTIINKTLDNYIYKIGDVKFKMIFVEGGDSNPLTNNYDVEAYNAESPVHSVSLNSFYIGETLVTQGLWKAVMGSLPTGTTGYGVGNEYPLYNISYNDIVNNFLPKLNELTGKTFRLPYEAEYEYAAKGGILSKGYKYAGNDSINDVAWFLSNSNTSTQPVKLKRPNELGIYDLSGNIWEWCNDYYAYYSSSSQTNPTGPTTGTTRVLRGGCWFSNSKGCRNSCRYYYDPSLPYLYGGLRLVLVN